MHSLIDEVGALLTESGGAQIIEIFSPDRFAAKAGDLGLRPRFAIDLCENKPYDPFSRCATSNNYGYSSN